MYNEYNYYDPNQEDPNNIFDEQPKETKQPKQKKKMPNWGKRSAWVWSLD